MSHLSKFITGFNNLELFFKKDFIRKNATCLAAVRHFNYNVKLYVWIKYLIEQYYDRDKRRITLIRLASPKALEKYENEIDISSLRLI